VTRPSRPAHAHLAAVAHRKAALVCRPLARRPLVAALPHRLTVTLYLSMGTMS